MISSTDYIVLISMSNPSSNINLPSSPYSNQIIKLKDISGMAETNTIIINGNGYMIDGVIDYLIDTNYGAVELYFDSSSAAWYVLGFTV